MQVAVNKQEPEYRPITLSLTFDTRREAETFYSLLNTSKVADALRSRGLDPDYIREKLNTVGIRTSSLAELRY